MHKRIYVRALYAQAYLLGGTPRRTLGRCLRSASPGMPSPCSAKRAGACPGLVNNLCSWLRRYLFRFPGMKKGSLQSCLNWFVCLFRVRRDEEKWPKTARVLRHLLMSDAHFRS